ncbi:uncharacterized protein LOC133714308 [Rosa rugosa]|uniref:uncharacterized protein LOC133714308 n=1 Tax=Rosa rugosa TaxID=74645 RepID=UPI002B40304F|nr:uncharacterized protein LOC133714308 [Rosa rugosa]
MPNLSKKKCQWNVQPATKEYRAQLPSDPNPRNLQYRPKQTPVEELYRRYKDPHEEMIMAEGISRLCTDLDVDPQDIVMLVMSWHMKAATMCEFSKQEFFNGLKALKIDSIEKFRSALPSMRSELKDKDKFKEVYNFTFDWAKEKGQKSLQLDTAIGMWQLLFAEMTPKWPYVDQWCEFLEERHKLAIPKDTWNQLLDFVRNVDPSLSNFDEERAWPCLVDDFVDYLKEKGLVQTT